MYSFGWTNENRCILNEHFLLSSGMSSMIRPQILSIVEIGSNSPLTHLRRSDIGSRLTR